MRVPIILLLSVSLLSAGCQANLDTVEAPPESPPSLVVEPTATSAPGSPSEGASQMTPSLPTPADARLQNLIDIARTDLAQRLSVLESEITLVEATSVVWPDSSLGCPEKGMAYAQVLTPGYLILLEHEANRYEYHSSLSGPAAFCQNPTPPVPGTPENT